MNPNNNYLRSIVRKMGGVVTLRKNTNQLLKEINLKLGDAKQFDTIIATITYEDDTTEDVELVILPNDGD